MSLSHTPLPHNTRSLTSAAADAAGTPRYLTAKNDGSARVYSRKTSEFTAPTYGLRYRLPSGVTCDNCVLQWW